MTSPTTRTTDTRTREQIEHDEDSYEAEEALGERVRRTTSSTGFWREEWQATAKTRGMVARPSVCPMTDPTTITSQHVQSASVGALVIYASVHVEYYTWWSILRLEDNCF